MVPTPDLFARSQFLSNPTQLTMTGSSVRNSSALAEGMYLLYATAAVAWLQGGSGVTATAASVPLPATTFFGPVYVTGSADGFIAAIAGSGTFNIIPVN